MSEPSTETPQKPVDEQPPSSSSPAPESSTDKPIEDKASSKYQQQQQQQQQPTRKRTRATAEQLAVLEDTFAVNVSPNSKLRKQLAEQLKMSERSIQIWFQNRRAKVKHMQKRAQIQMQQASIRAQLYHYHQQHYGSHPYGGPPLMPLPQQHHHAAPHPYYRPYTPAPPGPVARLPAVSRAQSVDAINHQRASSAPTVSVPPSTVHPLHTTTNVTPPPSHIHSSWPLQTSSITAPQHSSSSPSTSSPHLSLSQSIAAEPAMPALVSVPDAGPTAMLASTSSSTCSSSTSSSSCSQPATSASELGYAPSTPAATPPSALNHHHAAAAAAIAHNDLWCSPDEADHLGRAQSVSLAVSDPFIVCSRALSDPIVTTIDPSSLMMTPSTSASSSTSSSTTSSDSSHHQRQNSFNDATVAQQQQQQPECTQLSATTLTVGSWHRMKLRTDDLVCEYRADRHQFCWHIADNGCRFRMEIALDAVASIEYVANDCDVLADVHFDMSEPPLFYMEKNQEWIQCSDFTEGKQASRFFRHTLKGIAHHMKNDLLAMSTIHEETRRLVRFMETPAPYAAAAAADMMLTAGVPPPPPPPLGPHQFYWASAAIPPPPPPPPPHMINPFVSESACGYMS